MKINRRRFINAVLAASASVSAIGGDIQSTVASEKDVTSNKDNNMKKKNIIIAADPFALALKKNLNQHLEEKGYSVIDLGATDNNEIPYYESAPIACRAMQNGQAERAILLCGTGMGMAVIANRFQGIVASVVESVFAARMSRSINNANVLCLGSMIWGEWMAKEAVDVFLDTKFTQGLEALSDFLHDAEKKVKMIRENVK